MKITQDYTFIWDLDGTLIDSYKVIVSSLFTLSNKYNLNYSKDEINKIVIQDSVTAYIELLSKHTNINIEQLFSEYRALNDLHKDEIELVSNASETLNKIDESDALNFIYTHRGSSTNYLLDRLNSELLRLIEAGTSCFNHYCVGYNIRNHTSYTMSTGV